MRRFGKFGFNFEPGKGLTFTRSHASRGEGREIGLESFFWGAADFLGRGLKVGREYGIICG